MAYSLWIYFIVIFLFVWLMTALIFKLKQREILFWISAILPIGAVIVIFLVVLMLLLLPIIYLILFIYAVFARSYNAMVYGNKIKVE